MPESRVESREILKSNFRDRNTIIQGNVTVTKNFNADNVGADRAFLRKFSKTNPIDNKDRVLESKGGLLDGSYRWILQHEQFTKWCNTENSGVLWIKGDPGKGKTMLLCGIIKEFEKDSKIQERLAYFFCQGTNNNTNTSAAIIRGLIYLSLRRYPKLLSQIQEENKDEPDNFLEGDNERFALCRIFKRIVNDPCVTDPICIIDALDECQQEESLQSLFSLIVDTSSRVKWLLSSRNEVWIERGLCAVKEHQRLTLELKENSEHVSSAVKTYISHCIQDINALKDDAELRHKTAEILHAKANGTFLWVTLVVKELHNTSHPYVEAVLQSMPEELKELYDEILRRAKKRWKADERACLATLATVTAAKRPLLMEELYMFIRPTLIQSEVKYNIHSVKSFVEACGSFISSTDGSIYFIHQSVKDYMVQETNKAAFPTGIADQHFTMFEISISEMNKTLKRNEDSVAKSKGGYVYPVIPSDPCPYTAIEYCCSFWVEHLVEGCECQQSRLRECLNMNEDLHIFINGKYLYWLEAMIRLKLTIQAVEALHKLYALITSCFTLTRETVQGCVSPVPSRSRRTRLFSWISRITGLALGPDGLKKQEANQTSEITQDLHISELTRDLYRTVSQNRAIIERFPSQIYVSALVFSPMGTRLRTTYENTESPKWLAIKPVMPKDWDACLQTIESNRWIHFVTFAPDNSKLALIDFRDIKVWDLTTGALLQELHGGMDVTSVAFSSNGNTLALLFSNSVEIWDLVSGSLLNKIDRSGVRSVIFITGDAHLAMLGFDFFEIREVTPNVALYTYFGQPGEQFHDVLVSSHFVQQALGGIRYSVEAWSPANWMLVPFFTNKTFGTRLVVTCEQGASERLLKVVDPGAGEYMQTTMKRGVEYGKSLFFLTLDGMRLVLLFLKPYDNDMEFEWAHVLEHDHRMRRQMARVWDLATGLWQTIELPKKTLTIAAFSPCRMWLALASNEDIYVWDVVSGERRWTSTGHAERTAAMAFSPDGSRLALATNNNTIKVFDMTAGSPPQSRPDAIVEMVFSPRGKWLASCSANSVQLWDPTTGECLRTWMASSNVTALSFSTEDSAWLAAGDAKGTIHVYNAATGACYQTLTCNNGPRAPIDSIVFSSNGSTLASMEPVFDNWLNSTCGYILRTWDLAMGKCLRAVTLSGWADWADSPFRIARSILSTDSTQLGSVLENGIVIIWNASTGERLHILVDVDQLHHYGIRAPGTMEPQKSAKYSMTHRFAESFAKLSDYFSRREGLVRSNKAPELTMSYDYAWILWNQEPKIGIPPQYRPNIFVVHEDYCAIATHSHEVLCFRFSI